MKTTPIIAAGACFALAPGAPLLAASADDPADAGTRRDMEEVVVTGSLLRRSVEDSPSPLSVVTSADIEDLGAQDVAEIVAAMPWQSGSQTQATTFGGEGADGRNSINLRNLGHGATLPLVNGKRNVASWYNARANASVNVNGLVPNIAIERVEIVKDGGSVLYGSDAIAGVVNFITKKDFEGFDFSYEWTTDSETGEGTTNNVQGIWGLQGERGGFVVSAGILTRDEITISDLYERHGGSSASSTGQPGRFQPVSGQTITWAGNGVDPGNPVAGNAFPRAADGSRFGQADVDCEVAAAASPPRGGGPLGLVGPNICAYDFASFFALQAEERLSKFHVTGDYAVADPFRVYFEFAANLSEFDRLNSLNPNALNLTIDRQILDGEAPRHFGNIEDAARRGIEPIAVLNRTRLIGGTAFSSDEERPIDTFTDTARTDQRLVVGGTLDLDLAGRPWTLDLSFTRSDHVSAVTQVQDTLSTQMELAINGLGGPNCDPFTGTPGEGNLAYAASGGDFLAGNCYFFNPFGNSQFDRSGNPQTDLTLRNAPELYEWLLGRVTSDLQYDQQVIDAIFTGDLFDLGSGTVALALGAQRRVDRGNVDFDAATNTNNLDFTYGAQDWDGRLTATAFYAELGIPIASWADVNVAGRYEHFDEIDEDTFDPKITVLLRPVDSLSLRGSASSSFRVPSLQQLFGTRTDVANMDDLGDSAFRPFISDGNPDLTPETAVTWNVGLSWVPRAGFLDGFRIDLDYYDIDYEDIITREDFSTILAADNAALEAAIAGGRTLAEAVADGVGNREQVIRNAEGALLRVRPDFVNAGGAEVSGLDVNASYTIDGDLGLWRLGIAGAWVRQYDTTTPDGVGGTVLADAVGQYNLRNPIARPLPEFKVNGTLNWSRGPHAAYALVRWISSYDFPRAQWNSAQPFWAATVALANGPAASEAFLTENIDSMTTVDLQYSYTFPQVGLLASTRATVGLRNAFDEKPPWVPDNTGFDTVTHDFRGRMYFLRVQANF